MTNVANTVGSSPAVRRSELERLALEFHSLIESRSAGPIPTERLASWLRDTQAMLSWLQVQPAVIWETFELGPDLSKPYNFIRVCKTASRLLILAYPSVEEPLRSKLDGFATTPPLELEVLNCRVTHDYFTGKCDYWLEFLEPLAGKPNLRFLEVGTYEGLSATWLCKHVLTHPSSSLLCVDLFEYNTEKMFLANIRANADPARVDHIKGRSQEVLRKLGQEAFDFVYVDGSHEQSNVLEDAVLAWPLLKSGGLMIFDDYEMAKYSLAPTVEDRPDIGIDAFLSSFRHRIEVLVKSYQIAVKKLR